MKIDNIPLSQVNIDGKFFYKINRLNLIIQSEKIL